VASRRAAGFPRTPRRIPGSPPPERQQESGDPNLKSERGRALFERLAKDADVVVENLGPGAIERLGLGYERLRQINPRIVLASIKGFGSTGPYAQFKSYEWLRPWVVS